MVACDGDAVDPAVADGLGAGPVVLVAGGLVVGRAVDGVLDFAVGVAVVRFAVGVLLVFVTTLTTVWVGSGGGRTSR